METHEDLEKKMAEAVEFFINQGFDIDKYLPDCLDEGSRELIRIRKAGGDSDKYFKNTLGGFQDHVPNIYHTIKECIDKSKILYPKGPVTDEHFANLTVYVVQYVLGGKESTRE